MLKRHISLKVVSEWIRCNSEGGATAGGGLIPVPGMQVGQSALDLFEVRAVNAADRTNVFGRQIAVGFHNVTANVASEPA